MSLNLKVRDVVVLNCNDLVINKRELQNKISFLEEKAVLLKKLIDESFFDVECLSETLEQVFRDKSSLLKICDGIDSLIYALSNEFPWLEIAVE